MRKPPTSDKKTSNKTCKNNTKWLCYIHKGCKVWIREDLGGHNIAGHKKFIKNLPSGVSASQAEVSYESATGVKVSTITQDEDSDWYSEWWLIGLVYTFLNYMIISVFILLAPKIIMIRFLLEREKWVYESYRHLFTVINLDQSNKKPSPCRDTKVK